MLDRPAIADRAAPDAAALSVRQPIWAALVLAASVLGWAFLAWIALDMDSPVSQLMMPDSPDWSVTAALAVWAMWGVMMAAMMLPSAWPMLRTFAALSLRSGQAARGGAFAGAYLLVWLAFSGAAAAAQWALQRLGWTDPMAASRSAWLSGLLLGIAGAYQFTPLKKLCLTRCRSPLGFVLGEWRAGWSGAFVMGVRHGLFCVGCCWALMAVLFVGGVMNLAWIAALALAVAVEKLVRGGPLVGAALGAALIVGGVLKLAGLF
jgi:predicted metal-binding membrane protein